MAKARKKWKITFGPRTKLTADDAIRVLSEYLGSGSDPVAVGHKDTIHMPYEDNNEMTVENLAWYLYNKRRTIRASAVRITYSGVKGRVTQGTLWTMLLERLQSAM